MESRSFIKCESEEALKAWQPVFDANGNITRITVPEHYGDDVLYIRISCQNISAQSIISIVNAAESSR